MDNSKLQKEKQFHDERFRQEIDPRDVTNKFYRIAQSSWDYYWNMVQGDCQKKRVLEYGCGTGSYAFRLAQKGARVTGIDISEVAIERAQYTARDMGLDITFLVQNAEALNFPGYSFDLICGSGILHHLDVKKALGEIRRVLEPSGKAIFLEPMGHNPIINLYRHLTPQLRTEDEHPLRMQDLEITNDYFAQNIFQFFYLCTLGAFLFRNLRSFKRICSLFESFDHFLFGNFPFVRRYAWSVVITLSHPK